MTSPRGVVLAVIAVLTAAAAVRAQPAAEPAALRGDLPQTRKRLSEAEQKVLGGNAAEAVEDLQRILDEAGDDLVTIDGKQYRTARWYAHQILAKLPGDVLKAYQARIEEPARKLLEAGKRDHDLRPLRELLDRYFVSRPAQEGLLLLGDLLFERGEFRAAERQWRRLLPDASADLHHPAAHSDAAAIRARLILAAIFHGDSDRARQALASFRKEHSAASGTIGGKTGPYADALQGFLDRPPQLPPPAGGERTWPTLGGDAHRSGRTGGPMPYHWPSRPIWIADIPVEEGVARNGPLSPPARQPFGHPVIADGKVFVSDGRRIFSFGLRTGAPIREVEISEEPPANPGPGGSSSLAFASGRLYARLGPSVVRTPVPVKPGMKPTADSAIACFDLTGDRDDPAPRYREIWRIAPPAADGKLSAVWEGAPLVANRRMWAALARFEGGRTIHAIACFDPADSDSPPDRPAWIAEVCDSPMSSGSDSRSRQELLTLTGPNIVFCSNTGAVVAVDAVTGRRKWAFSYPRAARRIAEANRSPDPVPAVAADGRVFVAPADGDHVYALDAETGELLWESGLTEEAQILGVSRDRLIITVSGQVRGIRALNVRNGSHRPPEGWVQHNGGGPLTYGRGLVSDEVIVWPSRDGLYFLNPADGNPLRKYRNPLPEPLAWLFGNVAHADGVMVVVTPTQVWGYEAIAPTVPFRPGPPVDPRAAFEAMIDSAEAELAKGNEAQAREILTAAARADFPASWRAWAAARLLLLSPPIDGIEKLPHDVREVLNPAIAREWLLTADGQFLSLEALIDQRTGRAAPADGALASLVRVAERHSGAASALNRFARISRSVRLPPAAFPLGMIPGSGRPRSLFVASVREVLPFPLDGAKESRHAAAGAFTHAADLGEGFVAAGPFTVALYGVGHEPVWTFRVPETDALPERPGNRSFRGGEPIPVPQLSSFVLEGARLYARLGDRHLIAFDLKGQRVAWVLGSQGRQCFRPLQFPSLPRFEPYFLVSGRLILAQLSNGRRWVIDAAAGRVQSPRDCTTPEESAGELGQPTALVPWARPPVELDDNRFAFSDGSGLVQFRDLDTGEVKWAYQAGGESSLAGEPPQVRQWKDALLVAVRRNYGVELDRIDPGDGSSCWNGPAFLDATRIDLDLADADSSNLYVSAPGKLLAHSLASGKRIWETDLPATGEAIPWVMRAGRRVVIAYPSRSIAAESLSARFGRVTGSFRRLPLPWRLPWLAAAAYDPWTSRALPVLLLDPETGAILKRLSIPARGPTVSAYFVGEHAVIATGDRIAWLR
jgi:outer membrane protein assembly factor BamB